MAPLIKIMRMFLWMTCLTGLLYPLLITGFAMLAMKQKAEGDFISVKGKLVGSKLIGQKFEGDKYFWGRPSSIDYNPLPSGGSNLAPTSKALKKVVEERQSKLQKAHSKDEIPEELLYASGSGLDPHISLSSAYFQMERVAKARGVASEDIQSLVDGMVIKPFLGFIGEEYLNVLLLNLKLDEVLQAL